MPRHLSQLSQSILPVITLLLCVAATDKILAIDSPADNSCPPLSEALISPRHRIYAQLHRHYYRLSRPSNLKKLGSGTESPDPDGKIASLIKVGDYGIANWTKQQKIAVFFKKNRLVLARSQMVGYFEEPCLNCQDNRAAVESLEVILPKDANVTCIEKLYGENQRRLYL
jgi:hypothetical protein